MTLFRIEHAVVMDTDDIPGRGGYSVVGISRGVTQAERAFVAGNFGISDYLHDPKTEKRIFYSSFRVPGGRQALVRRFARGVRRNQTQNRLHVHTLFFEDEVLQRLHGLPWLLVNASVRAEGAVVWERLRDDVPWVLDGSSLPALEWEDSDGVTNDVVGRFNARLTSIGNQLPEPPGGASSPADLVARVIGALSSNARVLLPQGSAHELVTMLAWSMLPRRDREEIAWTQHDAANISGVSFPLANVVDDSSLTDLSTPAAPFASWVVEANTKSEESWRDFHERSALDHVTVRKASDIAAWQKWHDALKNLRQNLGAREPELVASMDDLARTGLARADAPWIDGQEVLQLLWQKVLDDVVRGERAKIAANTWGKRIDRTGLDKVIFRTAPDRGWIERAAEQVGGDALVWFFLVATEDHAESKAARHAVAAWLVERNPADVEAATIARLAVRLAADRSSALPPLLERALATDAGLAAFRENVGVRKDVADLVFGSVPIVLRNAHPGTVPFLREVFLPRVDPAMPRVKEELARAVGAALRAEPDAFLQFHARLSPDVAATLMELVTQWMFREPERTLPLARAAMRRIKLDPDESQTAGKLAIALASAGEPAGLWFDIVLQMARAIDVKNDAADRRAFLATLQQLRERPLQLDGAIDPLLAVLENDRVYGQCVRELVLFVRPKWRARLSDLVEALAAIVSNAALASAWEEIVIAFAADHGRQASPLISAFWLRVDPTQIPQLDMRSIDALAHVTPAARKQLEEHWSKESRVVRIPPSHKSDRLLALVVGEGVAMTHDVRTSLYWRELEQGIANVATLNRLERALHGSRNAASEVEAALEKFLGNGDAVARLVRLLQLLRSEAVQPTVKLLATRRVLPHALAALKKSQWAALADSATVADLLGRGVAVLAIARRAGAVAKSSTIDVLERIYDEHDRADAAQSLDAGWSTRSPLKSFVRLFRSDEVRIDGRPVSM